MAERESFADAMRQVYAILAIIAFGLVGGALALLWWWLA